MIKTEDLKHKKNLRGNFAERLVPNQDLGNGFFFDGTVLSESKKNGRMEGCIYSHNDPLFEASFKTEAGLKRILRRLEKTT